jgi:hydrogenase large subunit
MTMANEVVTIDPVSRIEGHLRVDLDIRDGVVFQALSSGTSFRGFEVFLRGRDPREAAHITQRICGVCPVPHARCATAAFEQAAGITVNNQARLLRNIIEASNFLDSHLLHFYVLALPDYVAGLPTAGNWSRSLPPKVWDGRGGVSVDTLVSHYVAHIQARRNCSAIACMLGGKLPHVVGIVSGGATASVTAESKAALVGLAASMRAFVESVYIADAEWLVQAFPEYREIGASHCGFLSYGGYLESDGTKSFPAGVVSVGAGSVQPLQPSLITESVARSRFEYAPPTDPSLGCTNLQLTRDDAYSFAKAARLGGAPMEVGPLARAVVAGCAPGHFGVMARHLARANEAARLVARLTDWVAALDVGVSACPTFPSPPLSGSGMGLCEAPRGALGHWLTISNGTIERYQVISPTTWNGSPRDEQAQPGPLEKSLEGVAVKDKDDPIEVLRIVHSFDPCLQCAVH